MHGAAGHIFAVEYPGQTQNVTLSLSGGASDNLCGAGCGVHHAHCMGLREDALERSEGEESTALIEASTVIGRCLEVGWVPFKTSNAIVEEFGANTAAAQPLQHANIEEIPVLVRGAVLEQM